MLVEAWLGTAWNIYVPWAIRGIRFHFCGLRGGDV